MSEPVLHSATNVSIKRFLDNPMHALGIEGEPGSGKKHIAQYICQSILQVSDNKNNPYILSIDCGSKTGIDQVRESIEFLKLKVPGGSGYKRCVFFYSFEKLRNEGQNALLKTLEEPPLDTLIILTVNSKKNVLPTIASRTSWLKVHPVSLEDAQKYFEGQYEEAQIKKAYALTGGRMGLLVGVLKNGQEHELVNNVQQAKEILTLDKLERLARIDELTKGKEFDAEVFLKALAKVIDAALKNQINKNSTINANLVKVLEKIIEAQNALKYNANTKLLLTDIFYSL